MPGPGNNGTSVWLKDGAGTGSSKAATTKATPPSATSGRVARPHQGSPRVSAGPHHPTMPYRSTLGWHLPQREPGVPESIPRSRWVVCDVLHGRQGLEEGRGGLLYHRRGHGGVGHAHGPMLTFGCGAGRPAGDGCCRWPAMLPGNLRMAATSAQLHAGYGLRERQDSSSNKTRNQTCCAWALRDPMCWTTKSQEDKLKDGSHVGASRKAAWHIPNLNTKPEGSGKGVFPV